MDSYFARLSLCLLAGGCLASWGAESWIPLICSCLTLVIAGKLLFGSGGSGGCRR